MIHCPGNRSAGNDPRNHKGYRNEQASLLTQSLICFGWLERAGVDAPTTAGLETGATFDKTGATFDKAGTTFDKAGATFDKAGVAGKVRRIETVN